ncbi:hypothetical protein MXB_5225, partial [Myxobolus squamalis]
QQEICSVIDKLPTDSSPEVKWSVIKSIIKKYDDKDNSLLISIMFQFCYPRIDVNVSKSLNHLLKSPFCVHPKTGSVCIPIDINEINTFDPCSAPTIFHLLDENNPDPSSHSTLNRFQKLRFEQTNTVE